MEELDEADLDKNLSDANKVLLADVILQFARLDTVLGAWVIAAFDMDLDRGSILIENMDISVKILKLKKLCLHIGNTALDKELGTLKKEFESHKDVRNAIAHA